MHEEHSFMGGGRNPRGRRGLRIAVALVVLGMVGSAVPASAHTKEVTGTLGTAPLIGHPHTGADWTTFVASQCADVKDGVNEAILDAVPFRNHKATVTITGSLAGAAADRKLFVFVGFANCLDTGGYGLPFALVAQVGWGLPKTFTVAAAAHTIVVMHASSNAAGITYRVNFSH